MRKLYTIRILLLLLLVVGVEKGWGQVNSFNRTYNFNGVSTSSGTTDPTPVPTITGLTFGSFISSVGTNPNSGNRFSFTGWNTGATNNSDVFTGTFNPLKYYEVTITPSSGYTLDLDSISFKLQRSSTGIRQYSVRSSSDYNTNLPASIVPINSNLSIVSTNIFQVSDATANSENGSRITLGTDYDVITTSVTFRFYGWNAEAPGGTFSIDDVKFIGSVAELPNSISLTTKSFTPFCNSSTNNIILQYTTAGTVNNPYVELSSPTGAFNTGTTNLGGTITSGSPNSITASIPAGQAYGTNYRVRITSTDPPPVSSNHNGSYFTIDLRSGSQPYFRRCYFHLFRFTNSSICRCHTTNR